MQAIKLSKICEFYGMKNLTPSVDISRVNISIPEVNRPSLQLAGFFDHFDHARIQVIGNVEAAYMASISDERKEYIYDRLAACHIPCIIYCKKIMPDKIMLKKAEEHHIPILSTDRRTASFTGEIQRWLNVQLAPSISIHGVLVDVMGEGVLIMGESGIGKSEAALELVKRGHRLVADDVVEISKVSDETLIGRAPNITKHLIELRGIGIIDIKTLYGVASVKETQGIDLVIKMEDWSRDKEYDRLGLEEEYTEFLGNRVACHSIPIRPGRNVAIIVETAAINHRQKKMGYNAAQELYRRVQENLMKRPD